MMRSGSIALLALLCGCTTSEPSVATDPAPDGGADAPSAVAKTDDATASRLLAWLEGKFDSSEQAKTDKTYLAITLATCRVDVPALGPRVLYVEQARLGSAPYRQRLYVIDAVDGTTARSRVFEPNTPSPLVGLCDASARPAIDAEDFVERDGCSVEMHWTGARFEGHTPDARWNGSAFAADPAGKRCSSSLSGASFATSEVTLERDRLRSWDRGFDSKNAQVWGATKGGYEFVRRSPAPDL